MKLTISRINKSQVSTKYGNKEKYGLQFKEKPGIWLDSFLGDWNKTWKVGDVLEIQKDQLKSREYNGKTYWTLQAPADSRGGFQAIIKRVEALEVRIASLESAVFEPASQDDGNQGDSGLESLENEPQRQEEIDVNEIPF